VFNLSDKRGQLTEAKGKKGGIVFLAAPINATALSVQRILATRKSSDIIVEGDRQAFCPTLVNAKKVLEALSFLIKVNPLYAGIHINDSMDFGNPGITAHNIQVCNMYIKIHINTFGIILKNDIAEPWEESLLAEAEANLVVSVF
jgi:hypothetical protein